MSASGRTRHDPAPTELRRVFAAFPSGVVAVCAAVDGRPVGMAVSTFSPVSLDPPLISLCIRRTSTTWPRLRRARALGVSILSADHERAGRQLAATTGDRFAGLATATAPSGAIHVRGSCAWFDCALEAEHPAGDHVIAVLRIDRSGLSGQTAPLVFHASRFRRLVEA